MALLQRVPMFFLGRGFYQCPLVLRILTQRQRSANSASTTRLCAVYALAMVSNTSSCQLLWGRGVLCDKQHKDEASTARRRRI